MITVLAEKRILLGVTGSIACYKAIDLASKLTQAGAKVDTVLTESAERFVSRLSFQTVTGRRAWINMWDQEHHVQHVRMGESADLLVVAPATAHTIAKLANGLADNLLTVTALAARCPILIAPAMDGAMYESVATQENLETLSRRGVLTAGPATGRMASGLVGKGRMIEASELFGHIRLVLGRNGNLRGRRVVVTAGPTQEPLDPVRYLSNRSSGKQGLALAQAALDLGAEVTLISGPVHGISPVGVEHIQVRTAVEMLDVVLATIPDTDALLMAAAVVDYRPELVAKQKIKKEGTVGYSVQLTRNPDILAKVQERKKATGWPKITVGFAAETQQLMEYGVKKLKGKGLDLIAINDVSAADAGFGVDTNRVILLDATGEAIELPLQSKSLVAERILEIVATRLEKNSKNIP